jgi:hypothetical protein
VKQDADPNVPCYCVLFFVDYIAPNFCFRFCRQCSEEVVVIGILRVVEEILERRPTAHIVINSIFPMTTTRGGLYPVISDYEDSFIRSGSVRSLQTTTFRQTKQVKGRIPSTDIVITDDTDLTEASEKVEQERDEKAKRERRHTRHPLSIQVNPIMLDDVTKAHKYKAVVPIRKQTDKPLWTSIRAINKELKKFADHNERVTYFDATPVFTTKLGNNQYQLLSDRISERGHPTEYGFRVWEDEMVKKLDEIITLLKRDRPELFKVISSSKSEGKNSAAPTNTKDETNRIDDEVKARPDDDVDDAIFHNDDGYDEQYKKETSNILSDPTSSDNDDDTVDGDLTVSKNTQSSDNDEGN